MNKKLLSLLIAVSALIISVAWLSLRPASEPLVSGKSVAYWLDRLPPEAVSGLLPSDNPLVQAGPEIVPPLIAAIDQSYAARDFTHRCLRVLPPFLRKQLPTQDVPAWQIREVAAFRLGLKAAHETSISLFSTCALQFARRLSQTARLAH